jgi:hypothetical protein
VAIVLDLIDAAIDKSFYSACGNTAELY